MHKLRWLLLSGLFVGLSACSDKEEEEDTDSEQAETDTASDIDITVENGDLDQDGYTEEEGDCDDANAMVYPNGDEICDGIDNNCDGLIDEDVLTSFYADSDGDGYGNPDILTEGCEPPEGYSNNGSDCDDGNNQSHPGADDIDVDGIDQDCDQVDGPDLDGDGVADYQFGGEDCDDMDDTVQSRPNDADCDGYEAPDDCDDTDNSIYPMAGDVAGDGVDSDCDEIDCDAEFQQGLVAESIVVTGNLDATADSTTTPLGSISFDGMTEWISHAEYVADYSADIEILDANHATQTLHFLFEHTMEGSWDYYVLVESATIETSFGSFMSSGMAFVISQGTLQFDSNGEIDSSTQLNTSTYTPWNFKDAPPPRFQPGFW